MPPRFVTQDEMNQILTLVDELEISREAIQVPLAPSGAGAVERASDGRIKITVPADVALDEWLPSLRERIRAL